MLTEKANFLAE